jgi:soluble lytic murein transglycosylase-like protein
MFKAFFFAVLSTASVLAHAGRQTEEPLAASVRSALSASLAEKSNPRFVPKDDFAAHNYHTWLKRADLLLSKRRKDLSPSARADLLETAYYEATRAGLEPALVLGLVQVESNFRTHAISSADARGLMQVMPFWTRLVGDADTRKLFDAHINLRYGCTILRHYIDIERGNLYRALGRYNGSLGKPDYPNTVLAAWRAWK